MPPWFFGQKHFSAHMRSERYLTHLRAFEGETTTFWEGLWLPKRVLFGVFRVCLEGAQNMGKVSQIPCFAASNVYRKSTKSAADLMSNGVAKFVRKSGPDTVIYETSLRFGVGQNGAQNPPLEDISESSLWVPKVRQVY